VFSIRRRKSSARTITRLRSFAVFCNYWNAFMANSIVVPVLLGDHCMLVFGPFVLIRFHNQINILETLLGIFVIESTLPWTLIVLHLAADYSSKSSDMLQKLQVAHTSGYLGRVYRSVRPCRSYFGGFFYLNKSSISGFFALAIDNLITLLVTY